MRWLDAVSDQICMENLLKVLNKHMKPSGRFELNSDDIKKWLKNVLIFSSPLLIIALTELQKGTPIDKIAPLLYAASINALIDLLKKFVSGN